MASLPSRHVPLASTAPASHFITRPRSIIFLVLFFYSALILTSQTQIYLASSSSCCCSWQHMPFSFPPNSFCLSVLLFTFPTSLLCSLFLNIQWFFGCLFCADPSCHTACFLFDTNTHTHTHTHSTFNTHSLARPLSDSFVQSLAHTHPPTPSTHQTC